MSEQPAQDQTPEGKPLEGVASSAVNAGESVEEMLSASQVRAQFSAFEDELAATLKAASEQFTEQQSALQKQIAQLQAQLTAQRATLGPPEALTLARSLQQRVASIAAANPDISPAHFAGVADQAARLADAAEAASGGKGPVEEVERLASSVGQWFTRAHPRLSSKVLEGAGSAVDEVERIIEGLGELAPVAAAVARAV